MSAVAAWPDQSPSPPFNKCLGCRVESNWPGKLSIKLFYNASQLDMGVNFPLDALLKVKFTHFSPRAILASTLYEHYYSLKMRESANSFFRIIIS